MSSLDFGALPDHLRSRRWFAGKASPIKAVDLVDHAALDGSGLVMALLRVTYELGAPELYLLPIRAGQEGPQDALDDDTSLARLLDVLRHRAESDAQDKLQVHWAPNSDATWAALPAKPAQRRFSGEQSNTSVVFDQSVILKVFRKLEMGRNPEVEMGRFLADRGFDGAAPLLGWMDIKGAVEATLVVAHRYLPNQGDGWTRVTQAFKEGMSEAPSFLQEVSALGRQVAAMHTALASDTDDPAFSPEPLQQDDLHRWSSSLIGEIGVTVALAETHVPELVSCLGELTERARQVSQLDPSGMKLRIHGDLHLGQVLLSKGRWYIFDFEGEPGRAFAQRREKQSPLKDVAGMLRSFSYAEAVARREGTEATGFAENARRAFLDGYFAQAGDAPWLPKKNTLHGLLDALELDKLLYELRYEVNHRPDWLSIPAKALLELAARPPPR